MVEIVNHWVVLNVVISADYSLSLSRDAGCGMRQMFANMWSNKEGHAYERMKRDDGLLP